MLVERVPLVVKDPVQRGHAARFEFCGHRSAVALARSIMCQNISNSIKPSIDEHGSN